MPSKFSTTLINNPVAYSGGASPIDYMMQCVRKDYQHNLWGSRIGEHHFPNYSYVPATFALQPYRMWSNPWHAYEPRELCLGWHREVSGGNVSHAITYQIPE